MCFLNLLNPLHISEQTALLKTRGKSVAQISNPYCIIDGGYRGNEAPDLLFTGVTLIRWIDLLS